MSLTNKSFKTLGFYLAPDQNMDKQFKVLLLKTKHLATAISTSSVNHREAYLPYFAVFQPVVSYVLPLTIFSQSQCHLLQVESTQLFLQKCGFISNMHRSVVFGALQSGGLGFPHPFVEQGIADITKILQMLGTPGYTQQLLLLCLHEWQTSSGMSFPLVTFPSLSCPHLEGT